MINTTQRDNELLATMLADLHQLEIVSVQQDDIINQVLSGSKMVLADGRQAVMEGGKSKNIDYSVVLRNSDYMRFYHPISLFVRVADEPRRSRTFDLTNKEYFTFSQAVNLLHDRPVAKPELIGRKIVDSWYALDEQKRDFHGNQILTAPSISEADLSMSLDRFPIKPSTLEKRDLMKMLKNGDLVAATFLKDGLERQTYIHVSHSAKMVVENGRETVQGKAHRRQRRFVKAF